MPDSPENTNATQAGASAGKPGETALDQLLAQWDQDTGKGTEADSKPPDAISGSSALKALKPVVEFAQQEMSERQTKRVNDDIEAAVSFINEDEDLKDLNGDLAIGMLEAFGRRNPDFVKAFEQRQDNPEVWKSGLGKARDWVKEAVGQVRGNGTASVRSDVEAAKAAVQGQTTQAVDEDKQDPVAMFNMSDTDWNALLQQERSKAARK